MASPDATDRIPVRPLTNISLSKGLTSSITANYDSKLEMQEAHDSTSLKSHDSTAATATTPRGLRSSSPQPTSVAQTLNKRKESSFPLGVRKVFRKPFRSPLINKPKPLGNPKDLASGKKLDPDEGRATQPSTSSALANMSNSNEPSTTPAPPPITAQEIQTSQRDLPATIATPLIRKRPTFRPPLLKTHGVKNASPLNMASPCIKRIEIQTLRNRVTELQSNIRNGKQVRSIQARGEEHSLTELIQKWKRVSQEAVMALLELIPDHYTNGNEAGFGMFDDDGWGTYSSPFQQQSQNRQDGISRIDGEEANKDEDGHWTLKGLERAQAQMDYEDIEQDLPTIQQSIRSSNTYSAHGSGESHSKLTKLQKLLVDLKVDPGLLDYDALEDAFCQNS